MANSFQTTQYVVDETLIRFQNYLSFAKTADRRFEDDFKNLKYATGSTIDYRLEERYLGGEGATAVEEDRVQIVRPLTIEKQFHTMVGFNTTELTFDRAMDEPYLDMYLNPAAKRLANLVEDYIATDNFSKQVYQASGLPGTALTFASVSDTKAYMDALGIPDDGRRYLGVDAYNAGAIAQNLYTNFNNRVNTGALMDGFVGELANFGIFQSNFLTRQTAGTGEAGGAPPTGFRLAGTVTGGPVSSGSSLSLTGLVAASQVFNEGDIIEVADASNVWMVNRLNYENIRDPNNAVSGLQRAQFVVTADVTSTAGGTATVPISPEIVVAGARQNISAAIPNGAQMYLRLSHDVSLAYHAQACVFAAPPMAMLKGGVEVAQSYSDMYKLSLTNTVGADVRNYRQLNRLDLICGVTINPEFAVRLCS